MILSRLADALNMSPALRRYYRDGVLPSAVFLALVLAQPWLLMLTPVDTPWRGAAALLPMPGLLWILAVYLRFLRECDELERRIELHAMVWSAAVAVHVGLALVFLLDAGTLAWQGELVAAAITLALLSAYILVRSGLHWKYR